MEPPWTLNGFAWRFTTAIFKTFLVRIQGAYGRAAGGADWLFRMWGREAHTLHPFGHSPLRLSRTLWSTPPHVLSRVFLSTLGIHDTSGMRLYYTSHLRKYDMGVLQLGISVFPIHFIPPGAEAFLSYGLCKTEKFEEVKLRRAFLEAPCLSVRVLARSLNSRSRATNLKND